MKKTLLLLVSLCLCLLLVGCGNKTDNKVQGKTVAQEKMVVTVLDVGQADAILLQTEGKNILVDSGLSDNPD